MVIQNVFNARDSEKCMRLFCYCCCYCWPVSCLLWRIKVINRVVFNSTSYLPSCAAFFLLADFHYFPPLRVLYVVVVVIPFTLSHALLKSLCHIRHTIETLVSPNKKKKLYLLSHIQLTMFLFFALSSRSSFVAFTFE